ncbi:MAG: hypothetical protein V1855_04720, partial [bacterium]
MKRLMLTLLALGLCGGTLFADTSHSKKTFLSPRAVGVNKAMEYTTWNNHIYTKWESEPTNIKSHIQVTPFYQASTDQDDIGRYFGIGNGSNTFKVGGEDAVIAKTADIRVAYLIDGGGSGNATVTFEPEQEVFGVRLDYFQCINRPIKGLFFKASTVVAHVQNDVNLKVTDEKKTNLSLKSGALFGMADFFAGKVKVAAGDADGNTDIQNPLTHAKIDGSQSETGIADIDLALGYKWLHDQKKYAYIHAGVTIPTGNKVRGEYLFEPLYGNGRHFGLGAGLDAGVEVWKGSKGKIRLDGSLN